VFVIEVFPQGIVSIWYFPIAPVDSRLLLWAAQQVVRSRHNAPSRIESKARSPNPRRAISHLL